MDPITWRLVPAEQAEAALVELVESATGRTDVRIGRHCPRCGSHAHGRPFVVGEGPPVSLARADGRALVAVGDGPLGVDLERAGAVSAQAAAAADLPTDGDPTRAWVRAEAAGKARGTGLAEIADPGDLELLDLDVGPGWTAAVAWVSGAGRAAPSR